MSLNRNKPYGEVCGTGVKYKYEQAGKYFDQHGNEVAVDGKPVPGGEMPQDLGAPEHENQEKPATLAPENTEKPEYTGMSVDQGENNQVPETEIDAVDGSDVEPLAQEIDDLTVADLKDMLDRMDVKYPKKAKKPDLQAMLRDEIKQREIEANQGDD